MTIVLLGRTACNAFSIGIPKTSDGKSLAYVLAGVCFPHLRWHSRPFFWFLSSRAEQAQTAGIVLALGAGILYVSAGCFWAVSANFAGEYAGLTSGIMNMGAQIGGACTASLTPLIAAHFGWQISFFVAALLALLGALAWLIVDPRRSLLTLQIPT